MTINQTRKPTTGRKYAIVVSQWPAWAISVTPIMFAGAPLVTLVAVRDAETRNEAAARLFAEAITAGDLAGALAVCHPDVELDSMLGISGFRYEGHEGIRRYFDDIHSAWGDWSVDVERTVEGPDGRVAIVMLMHARGAGSGVTLEERTAHVWSLQDGLLRRNCLYRDPSRALDDCGVPATG